MRKRIGTLLALVITGLAGYGVGLLNAARDQGQELMQLDRDFDLATSKNGVEGWVAYFAEDGIMLPAGHTAVIGRSAIRELMEPRFSDPGYSLRWEPVAGYVSGDLGYTYGYSKIIQVGKDRKAQVSYGKYVTIWRKQRDRSWKIAVDIGNSNPAPK